MSENQNEPCCPDGSCCADSDCCTDEKRLPPRRAFISSAAIGLFSGIAGLAGCGRSEPQKSADDAELDSLRQVDPKLIKYRQVDKRGIGLKEARGIAVDAQGTLWGVGDREIKVLSGMGGGWGVDGEPTCLGAAKDGTLYVGMGDHVAVYNVRGERLAAWPSLGESARITAIAAGEKDVWVANAGGREVIRYDREGQIGARFGKKDEAGGYPGLIVPSSHLDVALSGEKLFVSNPGMHRVETHDREGKMLSSWGTADSSIDTFCGCCNPTDFALFPDGRFVTAEKGIPRVKVYDKAGKFECVVAGPDQFPSTTMGLDIAIAADGKHIHILEPKAGVIMSYGPTEA